MERKWKNEFERLEQELAREEEEIVWVLVDGFILFWDKVSTLNDLDAIISDQGDSVSSLCST